MPNIPKLIAVFQEARDLISRPDNEFMYSGWDDVPEAVAEIDGVLDSLCAGSISRSAQVLFLPTGPLQEVSLSSGWGDEFAELANRFDEAMAAPAAACDCLATSPRHLIVESELGMDERFAEISLLRCADCGQKWVRYLYESEGFTGSGRWYLGAITPQQAEILALHNAKSILEGLDWYLYGGSYFQGQMGRGSGTILLNP